MIKKLWIILLLVVSTQAYSKSKCEFEWNQYKSIQSLLKQKSTEYLRKIEHEKHNEYQNCRKGKNKKSKSKSNTNNKYYSKQSNRKAKSHNSNYSRKSVKHTGSINGKFKGKKQESWLEYYKTPQECKNPKEIATFSKCVSHRNNEARNFNIVWASRDL